MENRVILHSDLNNFYASVEWLYKKELRGKPVAVAGDPGARHGIVLAKNDRPKRLAFKPATPSGSPGKNAGTLCLPRLTMTCI